MPQILVEVYVPAIGNTFDILIPRSVRVYELLPLIIKAVVGLSSNLFVPNETALCNGTTGEIYNYNMSVEEMKLKNGSKLLLI